MSRGKFMKVPCMIKEFRDFLSTLIVSASEMYALLGRVEDYFQNRHIYGYGVEESVSYDLLSEIKKVKRKLEGKIWEKE